MPSLREYKPYEARYRDVVELIGTHTGRSIAGWP